jgi:hypothetical protein
MIKVDADVMDLIRMKGQDYRICTACMGPALVPVRMKSPKSSDIRIPVGDNTLYVSKVQARYLSRITMDMLYDREDLESCAVF